MVNRESLSDVFKSENGSKHRCDSLSMIPSVSGNSSDSSNNSEVKVCVSTENNSLIKDSSGGKFVTREDSEDSLSWYLHLSEDLSSNKQHPAEISGSLGKGLSDETYISLNTPSLSFEDKRDNICKINSDNKLCQNSPDMFPESQRIVSSKENELSKKVVLKIKDNERHKNSENLSEKLFQEHSSDGSQTRTSSDSEGCSEISSTEEEPSSHDFQCSQESFHDSPEPQVFPDPQDCPLDCRERQEEWDSQELTRVSERLALRRKQARRLILTIIRKRQMSEETLDAFKKRLKKF